MFKNVVIILGSSKNHQKSIISCLTFICELLNVVFFVRPAKIYNSIIENHLEEIDYSLKYYVEPFSYANLELSKVKNYDYVKDIVKKKIIEEYKTNPSIFKTTISSMEYLKEYKIFTIEFHRVETPFIIGIWIFFASLAKIEKFELNIGHKRYEELEEDTIYLGLDVSVDKEIWREMNKSKPKNSTIFLRDLMELIWPENELKNKCLKLHLTSFRYAGEERMEPDRMQLLKGFHMAPKFSKIFPESCLLIVVGVVIGLFLFQINNVHMSPLTPDTFFLYMLPPIILDAGYFMPNRLFFDHLGTILLFAVIGTIFNTLSIGFTLWLIGRSGFFSCETPILDMLLFAALISAVDPVAVLAVFEEIHVNEILYIVVFGESLLNDAVTVVLYHMFEAYSEMGHHRISYSDILSGLASFFVVAIGGTIIGVIWGFTTGFVTRFTNQVRVIEPIFIFVMAYLAYLTAEIFHMSGILA
ncbi:sodium/hydrogen exchanger 3 isoform X2 [Nasonia vitripennis]|uniref:Sodium/hydrogen exchanger n=1 Tax=Nasonia vitripennis TaxID=7425 RepID=A0A7M7QJC0_NASVI|nr:sodium/hydrogen exchanger 3 isoform X2 [Nasonia vitripennis]